MSLKSVAKTLAGCVVQSELWSVETRKPASVDLGAFWAKWASLMYRTAQAPRAAAAAWFGCDARHIDEEFESAILVGLVRAAKKWNPGRSQFQTFCVWIVRQECQTEASRLTGLSRPRSNEARVTVQRLDAPRCDGSTIADTIPDRSDRVAAIDRADRIAAIDRAIADLGDKDKKRRRALVWGYRLLREFAAGHTIAQIAWREDISPQWVRQILESIRLAIRSRINFQGEAA